MGERPRDRGGGIAGRQAGLKATFGHSPPIFMPQFPHPPQDVPHTGKYEELAKWPEVPARGAPPPRSMCSVPPHPQLGRPLTLSLWSGSLGGRRSCRVSGWPGSRRAMCIGHQVPGRAEARQGPKEAAQGLHWGGGGVQDERAKPRQGQGSQEASISAMPPQPLAPR